MLIPRQGVPTRQTDRQTDEQLTGLSPWLRFFSSSSTASLHLPFAPDLLMLMLICSTLSLPVVTLAARLVAPSGSFVAAGAAADAVGAAGAAPPSTAPSTTGASKVFPGSPPVVPAKRQVERRPDLRPRSAADCSTRRLSTGDAATGASAAAAAAGVEVGPFLAHRCPRSHCCCCPAVERAWWTHPSAISGLSARRTSERSRVGALVLSPPRCRRCGCRCRSWRSAPDDDSMAAPSKVLLLASLSREHSPNPEGEKGS